MTIFESIILGLIQGLAEFLPVSSSGHLAILQHFFEIDGEKVLPFAVLLHVGTLISLILVYYKDLWELIKELGALFSDVFKKKGANLYSNDTRKLGILIIVATIPTGFIGIFFGDLFEKLYTSMLGVGICLLITSLLLFLAEKSKGRQKSIKEMSAKEAVLIGIFQGIAIAPGISRSGSTIVGGLFSGLSRELTVRFAFLISVPSILGAVVLEAPAAFKGDISSSEVIAIIVGVTTAAVSGYFAIKVMIKIVTDKKLTVFSAYTALAGTSLIIYTLLT